MFPVSTKYINKKCGLHLHEYQKMCPNTGRLGIINGNGKFIRCHDHKHITRKEYEKIIPLIIDEFCNRGFTETVEHFEYTPNTSVKEGISNFIDWYFKYQDILKKNNI